MFIPNKEKHLTFTKEQKEYLLEIADCIRNEFNVSTEQLSPLYALIYIDLSPLSEKDIKRAEEIWDKIENKCSHNFMLRSVCCHSIPAEEFIDVCFRCRELTSWANICEFCGKQEKAKYYQELTCG